MAGGAGRTQYSDLHARQVCTGGVGRSIRQSGTTGGLPISVEAVTIADAVRTAARRLRVTDGRLQVGSPAPAIRGVNPDGTPASVNSEEGEIRVLFLTSDCVECKAAWQRAGETSASTLVVVTPGPETDSRHRVSDLSATHGVRVVMASDVWHAFGVSKAPWVVDVKRGLVAATGPFK